MLGGLNQTIWLLFIQCVCVCFQRLKRISWCSALTQLSRSVCSCEWVWVTPQARQWKLCIFNETSLKMDRKIGREVKDKHEETDNSDWELLYITLSLLFPLFLSVLNSCLWIVKVKRKKKESEENDQYLCLYMVHTPAQISCDSPVLSTWYQHEIWVRQCLIFVLTPH